MRWEAIPETIDAWAVKVAAPAWDIKRAVAGVFTDGPVGYYWHPENDAVALYVPPAPLRARDLQLCKAAAAAAVGHTLVRTQPLTLSELATDNWVKVAYSPALRRAGELLNFFPGQYPGGIPNAPSPVAAMLTTGLVGGGLGYGTGWLAEKLLPKGYGRKLKRSGAVLGALLGAAPGAAWLGTNLASGLGPFDGSLLAAPPTSSSVNGIADPRASMDLNPATPAREDDPVGPEPVKVGSFYKNAVQTFTKRAYADNFGGYAPPPIPTPYDVNINTLGQTLWQAGATPNTAGSVMGTMYAAQQLPDPRSSPGWVTAGQLGQLAANAGKDYITGALVGAAINTVIGTPFRASTFGAGNAALGIIKAVMPALFGG